MASGTRAKVRAAAAAASGLLGLADDALGEVGHILADPLDPRVAVALGSTAKGLRGPMEPALTLLRARHAAAGALAEKMRTSCAQLREATRLDCGYNGLTAADMETLAMLIKTNGLRKLGNISMIGNRFGDAGMLALLAGMGPGSLPRVKVMALVEDDIGPMGAAALATALAAGALPRLTKLGLGHNNVGDEGVAKLAVVPLRQRPIWGLSFCGAGMTDKGVASLLSNLGAEEFQKLAVLYLADNQISDAGCAMLVSTIDSGKLPAIESVGVHGNPASGAAQQAVLQAVVRATQVRAAQRAPQQLQAQP